VTRGAKEKDMQRLVPSTTLLAVIDVQDRLVPALPPPALEQVTRGITVLLEAARLLGAPVAATEQYPKGLGRTIAPIAAKLDAAGVPRIEKVDFSACGAPEFRAVLDKVAPAAVVVVGIEAHVCVFQTVRDLRARGLDVYVPIDAVGSRRDDHRDAGIALCERAGAMKTTAETVVFDWLERAGTDAFRALSKLIR
jgi:nicotinamidase-related amidase